MRKAKAKSGVCVTVAGLLGLAAAAVFGCRTGGGEAQLRGGDLVAARPMAQALLEARDDLEKSASIKPSEIWERLGIGPGGKAARIAMLTRLLRDGATALGGIDLQQVFEQSFELGPEFLRDWFADATGDALLAKLAARLDEMLESDPKKLDRFPTVPLAAIPAIQAAMFARASPTPHPKPPLPFPEGVDKAETAGDLVMFADGGCAASAEPARTPILPEAGLYSGHERLDRRLVPCFFDNGAKLAQLVNRLANTVGHSASPATEVDLRVRFAAEDADDLSYASVRGYEDLLALFEAQGFTVEIFSTRVVADFLGLAYSEDGQSFRPVRQSLWMSGKLGDETVRIPAEHGEIGLILHREGRRFAEIRYYLGMPDPAHAGVSSYWRARTEKDSSWSGKYHERIESFAGYRVPAAKAWLESVANTMRGFQAAHDRLGLPLGSYGVFVCSDSLVMASAVKQAAEGTLTGRISNAFPIVRAAKGTVGGVEVDVEELIAVWAAVEGKMVRGAYPTDPGILGHGDGEEWRKRLRVAFPPSLDTRFGAFPEFQAVLRDTIRAVP